MPACALLCHCPRRCPLLDVIVGAYGKHIGGDARLVRRTLAILRRPPPPGRRCNGGRLKCRTIWCGPCPIQYASQSSADLRAANRNTQRRPYFRMPSPLSSPGSRSSRPEPSAGGSDIDMSAPRCAIAPTTRKGESPRRPAAHWGVRVHNLNLFALPRVSALRRAHV